MDKKDALNRLEKEIDSALADLTPKQKKFAMVYGEGNVSAEQAALDAGYTKRSARCTMSAIRRRPKIAHALKLITRKHQLEHGVSAAWKRQKLVEIVEQSADPESEQYNASAANQAIRTLAEIDGDFKPREIHHRGTMLNINLDYDITLPERGVVIETVPTSDRQGSDGEISKQISESDSDDIQG